MHIHFFSNAVIYIYLTAIGLTPGSSFYSYYSYYYYYYYYYSLGPVRMNAPARTAALGLLCNPKYYFQPRFRSPVTRMKRQRSLTEAVRMSVGSTSRILKTL
jgi:hypothetical protein